MERLCWSLQLCYLVLSFSQGKALLVTAFVLFCHLVKGRLCWSVQLYCLVLSFSQGKALLLTAIVLSCFVI